MWRRRGVADEQNRGYSGGGHYGGGRGTTAAESGAVRHCLDSVSGSDIAAALTCLLAVPPVSTHRSKVGPTLVSTQRTNTKTRPHLSTVNGQCIDPTANVRYEHL